MNKTLVILGTMLLGLNAISAEVDQFTNRDEQLEDSSVLLNKKAGEMVKASLKEINETNSGCDEAQLYKELRKSFANHAKGQLTIYALKSDEIEKRKTKIQDSVFKDWTIFDGYILGKPGANDSELALSPLIKMGDITIGVDKFEHIFGRGFSYFTHHYLKGKSVEKTIKGGIFGEKTIYGGNKLATGVFSYADLSANFNGMRFWNHVLQKREDVLGDNFGPYIACQNNKWEQVKEIDFTHYFDSSMDEAINCSKFPTKKTAKKYADNVAKVMKGNTLYDSENCPIDHQKLNQMEEKYGEFSKWIINSDKSDRTISYFGEYK
jgi:hypothetical protein